MSENCSGGDEHRHFGLSSFLSPIYQNFWLAYSNQISSVLLVARGRPSTRSPRGRHVETENHFSCSSFSSLLFLVFCSISWSDAARPKRFSKLPRTSQSKKQGKRRASEQFSSESVMTPDLYTTGSRREKFSQTPRLNHPKPNVFFLNLIASQRNP